MMRGLIQLRRRSPERRSYRFPFPPFPVGWYAIGEASAFPPGTVRTLHRFGRDLVVFCTESGKIGVLDAACPHLGADLGGGRVRGEEIVCPFHGFGFGADGACLSLPEGYGGRVPSRLTCRPWVSRSVSGLVVVWFDPTGGQPRWDLPELLVPGYRPILWRSWHLRTHPQETGEGSVDLGHLRTVHQYLSAEATSRLETDGPFLRARYRVTRRAIRGVPGQIITMDIAPELCGLGFSWVDVVIREPELEYRVWVLATPIDGELVDYRVGMSMREPARPGAVHPLLDHVPKALFTRMVETFSFLAFANDVELDFGIWENKAYVHPPSLVEGDGPIGAYRRWARQFYPEVDAGHRSHGRGADGRAPGS